MGSLTGSFARADLPVLEPLDEALPLEVSLVEDGFLEDSNSLVLLLLVFFYPGLVQLEGLHHHHAFFYGLSL
ncbi:hypothetical protein Tco_0498490, partial [Tanacetum coccineum]